jgi:hypothetical protein
MPPSFQCLCMAVNGERMRHSSCSCLTHAARSCKESLVFPYPHRETAEHRVGSKLHDRPDGDVLSLGQYYTVGAGEEHIPPEKWNLVERLITNSPHRSPLPLPLSLWCPPPWPLPRVDVTLKAIQKKMSRGTKGACGARCRSSRAPIIPISYVPFLSCYFPPLPCLFLLFLSTSARVLVPFSSFVAFRVHFSQWAPHSKGLYSSLAQPRSLTSPHRRAGAYPLVGYELRSANGTRPLRSA